MLLTVLLFYAKDNDRFALDLVRKNNKLMNILRLHNNVTERNKDKIA